MNILEVFILLFVFHIFFIGILAFSNCKSETVLLNFKETQESIRVDSASLCNQRRFFKLKPRN